MKPLTAFIFTALIFVNLFGFYTLFVLQQVEVKTEMRAQVQRAATDNRQTLRFSKNEFTQLSFSDNGKELRLDGKLYDVVSIQHTSAGVCVTVEYDSKETALVEAFGSLFSQQQGQDGNTAPLKNFISHFQQDYVTTHYRACKFFSFAGIMHCIVYRPCFSASFVGDNHTPPPQFFLV